MSSSPAWALSQCPPCCVALCNHLASLGLGLMSPHLATSQAWTKKLLHSRSHLICQRTSWPGHCTPRALFLEEAGWESLRACSVVSCQP